MMLEIIFKNENMVSLVSRTGRHLQRYNKGRRIVVGCIPYRLKSGKQLSYGEIIDVDELELLMISSQSGRGMLFPKGGWEMDENIEDAALRETIEEAGVVGNVECELGKWSFKSKRYDTLYEGYMFPLLVKEQLDLWPEKDIRQRKWMTAKESREVCQREWMKEALDVLVHRLTRSPLQTEEEDVTTCALS